MFLIWTVKSCKGKQVTLIYVFNIGNVSDNFKVLIKGISEKF